MAVSAPDDPIAAGSALDQVCDQSAELRRNRVARGIWHIESPGAGADHFAEDLHQKLRIAARGILGGELDVIGKLLGEGHRFDRCLDDLLAGHAQLMLEMNIRGRDESMNSWLLGALDRFQSPADIAFLGARETDHARPADLLGNAAHRLEVAVR